MKVVQAVSPWGVSKLATGLIPSFTITDQIETKEKDKATTRGHVITMPLVLVLVDVRGAHSQAVPCLSGTSKGGCIFPRWNSCAMGWRRVSSSSQSVVCFVPGMA